MNVPAFIDISEYEQLAELRSYLNEKGASLEKPPEEDLIKEIHGVISSLDFLIQDDSIETVELEMTLNSVVSLVIIIPIDQAEELTHLMCEKLNTGENDEMHAAAKIRVLNNMFHGFHEKATFRYTIFFNMIKIAGRSDNMQLIDLDLAQIHRWLEIWEIPLPEVQNFYRVLHESLVSCKYSEKATKVMLQLLSTYTEENASQARDDAHRCIVTHLADPTTFILDHLLKLKPVQFLEGELIHDLLTIFVSSQLKDYLRFYEREENFIHSIGLSHESNLTKMRILTMMSIAETKKEINFDTIIREMKIEPEKVEEFIIDLVRTKAVSAKIDGLEKKVVITSTTHRTFKEAQWQQLRSNMCGWQQDLNQVLATLQALLHHVTQPTTTEVK